MSEPRRATPAMLVCAAIFTFLFVQVVALAAAIALGIEEVGAEHVEPLMIAQGGGSVVALVATGLVAGFAARGGLDLGLRWNGRRPVGLWLVGTYVLVLMVWVPAFQLVYPSVLEALGVPLEPQPHLEYFVEGSRDVGFWLVVLAVCVVGPAFEELLFRGYLQPALCRWCGATLGIAATSLLFGFLHGAVFGLPLAVMGAFFGYLRWRDDALATPVAAHVLHNSTTVAVTVLWPQLFNEVYSG